MIIATAALQWRWLKCRRSISCPFADRPCISIDVMNRRTRSEQLPTNEFGRPSSECNLLATAVARAERLQIFITCAADFSDSCLLQSHIHELFAGMRQWRLRNWLDSFWFTHNYFSTLRRFLAEKNCRWCCVFTKFPAIHCVTMRAFLNFVVVVGTYRAFESNHPSWNMSLENNAVSCFLCHLIHKMKL